MNARTEQRGGETEVRLVTVKDVRVNTILQLDLALQQNSEAEACFLRLDLETGRLYVLTRDVGRIPEGVLVGITLEWPIAPLSGPAADALMNTVKPFAQRVLDGSEVTATPTDSIWDDLAGSVVSESARTSYNRIAEACGAVRA